MKMKKDAFVYMNTSNKAEFERQTAVIQNYAKYRFSLKKIFHDNVRKSSASGPGKAYREMTESLRTDGIENLIVINLQALAKNPDSAITELRTLTTGGITVYCADGDFIGFDDDPARRRKALIALIDFMEQYRTTITSSAAKPAKETGKKKGTLGRPRILDGGQQEALIALRRSGASIGQICTMFNVSRSTVSKILAAHPELKGVWKGTIKKET